MNRPKKMAKRRKMYADYREAERQRAAQRLIWDAQVKAQSDWNAKPSDERVADARYVLRWRPHLAEGVMNGYIWMADALKEAKKAEEEANKVAAGLGMSLEEAEEYLLAGMIEAEQKRRGSQEQKSHSQKRE